MSKAMLEIKDNNFKEEVLNSDVPVLADFWAEWCAPCRMIALSIDELAAEYNGKVKFVKVNVDDNTSLVTELQILSIPVLILFKSGKELTRIVGANTKDFIKEEIEGALK